MLLFSSLVFLGVICSRCYEQHHCLHRDFSTSKTTALPPPLLPLLRSDHRLHHRKVLSPICLSVKYRLHQTFHAPPRATRILGVTGMRLHAPPIKPTRRHAPTRSTTRRHVPARARVPLLTSALSDVIHHVICWHHPPRHLLTSLLTRPLTALTLTVDFFHRVDFFSPGSSYPVFRVDFIFAVCFCILCL